MQALALESTEASEGLLLKWGPWRMGMLFAFRWRLPLRSGLGTYTFTPTQAVSNSPGLCNCLQLF